MDLLSLDRAELLEVLRAGHSIDPRDPITGVLRGWNVRQVQNALDAEFIDREKNGAPVTFGHYEVVTPLGRNVPRGCDRGLLIDYGIGANGFALSRFRDPIVALEKDDPTRLLGWTFVDLGGVCVGTPSFFSLTRADRARTRTP